jgi:hypothetical protein
MSDVPNEDQRAEWILPEDNLIMLGIVGIKVNNKPGCYAFSDLLLVFFFTKTQDSLLVIIIVFPPPQIN